MDNDESRLRKKLRRNNYKLMKNTSRNPEAPNYGGFMIVDSNNCIVLGAQNNAFELDLSEVAAFID